MREKLKALLELQKIDLEIAAVKKTAEVHPKQIAELERELEVARSATEAERQKLHDIESQKRNLEETIASDKDTVKKWEQRLAEQRSTREYSALAREIDIKRKSITTMQEDLQELGRTQATQRETLKSKETEYGGTRERITGSITDLRQKHEASGGQIKNLEEKRTAAAKGVDANLLRRYDTVRKKKMPALVPVIAGTCQGCNMNIPPQMYNQLRTHLGTDVCPSCNRIIHASEALEAPAKS
jgi:predicted  nucleic acid-binding Zn-ribbon protein